MAGIAPRVFLMRNVNDDAPVAVPHALGAVLAARAADAARDHAPDGGAQSRGSPAPAAARRAPPAKAAARPVAARRRRRDFPRREAGQRATLVYRPRIVATAELHYADKPAGVDSWTRGAWLAPLADGDGAPDWAEATAVPDLDAVTAAGPVDGAAFAELPGAGARREELCRLEQGARRLALPERRGGTALVEVAEAHVESRRERGRLPRAPRAGACASTATAKSRSCARSTRRSSSRSRTACSARPTASSARSRSTRSASSTRRSRSAPRCSARSSAGAASRRPAPVRPRAPPGACSASAATSRARARASSRSRRNATSCCKRIEQEAGALTASLDPGEHRAREAPHRAAQVRHRDRPHRHRLGTLARRRRTAFRARPRRL